MIEMNLENNFIIASNKSVDSSIKTTQISGNADYVENNDFKNIVSKKISDENSSLQNENNEKNQDSLVENNLYGNQESTNKDGLLAINNLKNIKQKLIKNDIDVEEINEEILNVLLNIKGTIEESNLNLEINKLNDLIFSLNNIINKLNTIKPDLLLQEITEISQFMQSFKINMNSEIEVTNSEIITASETETTELILLEKINQALEKIENLATNYKSAKQPLGSQLIDLNETQLNSDEITESKDNHISDEPNSSNKETAIKLEHNQVSENKKTVNSKITFNDKRTQKNSVNQLFDNNHIDLNGENTENKLNNNSIQLNQVSKLVNYNSINSFNNIVNQIIESANITIDDNTSEMLLRLKPESLGDISMKIVIERGIVIAKFDVENYIVKEAIESNLDDLRSALDDKGLQVQEFSVSVNHNSNGNQNQYYFKKKNPRRIISNENIDVVIKEDYYNPISKSLNNINSTIDYLG